jgi:hypothetical protein
MPLARMVPIGPGGLQSGFSTLRYVRSTKGLPLSQKNNRVRGLPAPAPRPPGGPPVLGSLVLSVARGRAA